MSTKHFIKRQKLCLPSDSTDKNNVYQDSPQAKIMSTKLVHRRKQCLPSKPIYRFTENAKNRDPQFLSTKQTYIDSLKMPKIGTRFWAMLKIGTHNFCLPSKPIDSLKMPKIGTRFWAMLKIGTRNFCLPSKPIDSLKMPKIGTRFWAMPKIGTHNFCLPSKPIDSMNMPKIGTRFWAFGILGLKKVYCWLL